MPIQDIRNNVTSVEHAYSSLELINAQYEQRLSRWQMGAWILCVAGLAVPGPVGQTALCLGVAAGMHWLRLVIQGAGRLWFMHHLALHDLLAPSPGIDWAFLSNLLAKVPAGAVHSNKTEASDDAPPRPH